MVTGALRWVRAGIAWAVSRWPGRIVFGTVRAVLRLEVFDRAMTLAAQLFTSIFPLLIMVAVLLGQRADDRIAELAGVPETTREVLGEAVEGSGFGTFGVVGCLVVLLSATSLARAIIRAFAAVWSLPRIHNRPADAWRWLVAVLAVSVIVVGAEVIVRTAQEARMPVLTSGALTLIADTLAALFLPWLLLAHRVTARLLAPGAVAFAVAMLVLRPVGEVYLPHALEVSATRFGSIGVAFTYLGWLYVLSFAFLVASAAGQVLATDSGRLGRWIRGTHPTRMATAPGPAPMLPEETP